jgi:hypothetical protein
MKVYIVQQAYVSYNDQDDIEVPEPNKSFLDKSEAKTYRKQLEAKLFCELINNNCGDEPYWDDLINDYKNRTATAPLKKKLMDRIGKEGEVKVDWPEVKDLMKYTWNRYNIWEIEA